MLLRFVVALVVGVLPIVVSGADAKAKIIMVGDSTVTDKSGWGLGFKELLTGDVECINTAAGGRSSRSFIAEGKWQAALAFKGDYYLLTCRAVAHGEVGHGPPSCASARQPSLSLRSSEGWWSLGDSNP